jgi:hypothetical protein
MGCAAPTATRPDQLHLPHAAEPRRGPVAGPRLRGSHGTGPPSPPLGLAPVLQHHRIHHSLLHPHTNAPRQSSTRRVADRQKDSKGRLFLRPSPDRPGHGPPTELRPAPKPPEATDRLAAHGQLEFSETNSNAPPLTGMRFRTCGSARPQERNTQQSGSRPWGGWGHTRSSAPTATSDRGAWEEIRTPDLRITSGKTGPEMTDGNRKQSSIIPGHRPCRGSNRKLVDTEL